MAHKEEIKQDEKDNNWNKLPNNPAKYFPQPVYWVDTNGKEHIFVCADYDDPTVKSKLQSYCINDSKWSQCIDYPKNSKPYRFTISIDQKQGLLYIYGGTFAVFLQYDLKQKKWITICKNGQYEEQDIANKHNIKQTGWYPTSIFVNKNINTFHVFSGLANKHHLIWDTTSKKMKSAAEFKVVSFGHNALWIPSQSKAYIMGGIQGWGSHSNIILSCNITSNQKVFSWKNCNFSLPLALCYFGCICYNNKFIILFGGEKEGAAEIDDIWYFNTMKIENGWIKSDIKCPRIGRYYAVKTNNNKVHLFQMGNNNHWVIDINKIIIEQEEGKNDIYIDNNNNNNLQQRVKELEHKLSDLNDRYKVLEGDHKILQEQYERQGKELKKFREEYGFDESNYLKWNSDKIVDWIMSLEWPRYCKYEFNLRNNLQKENVDGEILGYVNRTDWTRFGINDIKDKIDLEKHLAKLIPNYNGAKKGNNDNNVEVEQEEGQETYM